MPTTQTITRTLIGINPIGNNTWRIQFNPADTRLTLASDTFPVVYYSSSALPFTLNPFLNNISNWDSNDYNAIINNATIDRLSELYRQVDYSTNQAVPINFASIISGSAYPASVQDSNYTSYQYSGIRYWGSKNTTDNFNISSVSESLYTQDYQNTNIGATTLGYPSVNKYDASILEFNWGGGAYPEIAKVGVLSLNQLLNVGETKENISNFNASEDGFLETVSLEFPVNSKPVFNQYTTNATTTSGARVLGYGFSTPPISQYMISSDNTSITSGFGGNTTLTFANNVSRVNTNSSGYYITGSTLAAVTMSIDISSSLAAGDRWFVTLYQDLPNPVQGNLFPLNSGSLSDYSQVTNDGYVSPLLYNGVFEVSKSVATGTPTLWLYNTLPVSSGFFGNGGFGMLIWKSIEGSYMLFNNATLSGVGKGGLVTSTSSPVIQHEFTYITQNFGTNPKNQ